MKEVVIKSNGIKRALNSIKPMEAVLEYIWNGFDATANKVTINYEIDQLEKISYLTITDNGYGINRSELEDKFSPIFASEKQLSEKVHKKQSAVHGKNGFGRLTFFKFCNKAIWDTKYSLGENIRQYQNVIESSDLTKYIPSEEDVIMDSVDVGTTVRFDEFIEPIFPSELKKLIIEEFSWFIHLNSKHDYTITFNDEILDFEQLIDEQCDLEPFVIDGKQFEVKYIQWRTKPGSEYSCFYFINSFDKEVHKETTLFNRKGDSFYHSMYVKSTYFDSFDVPAIGANEKQMSLFLNTAHDKIYSDLKELLNDYLRKKRTPFLKISSKKILSDFKKDNAFPHFNLENTWEVVKKEELENLITELYIVEPKIFSNLNKTQKQTFAHLLNLIMDSGERSSLFTILEQITELNSDARKELADILHNTHLSNLTKTIQLIESRVQAINQLQELVFNKELKANERDDLQKFVENHYWIFGEQYALAAAAEDKFEKALRKYCNILERKDVDTTIAHPSKNKEMDIMMVRQDLHGEEISNIVVELKAPWIKLGKKQYDQLYEYMDVITSNEVFNDSSTKWIFILVGNQFDSSNYIENLHRNATNHGRKSIVFKNENCEIYIKKWSEIINEFEIRHRSLLDRLKLKREEIYETYNSAEELIAKSEKLKAQ